MSYQNILDWSEEQKQILAEARSAVADIDDLNADDQKEASAKYDRAMDKYLEIGKKIEREQKLVDLEKEVEEREKEHARSKPEDKKRRPDDNRNSDPESVERSSEESTDLEKRMFMAYMTRNGSYLKTDEERQAYDDVVRHIPTDDPSSLLDTREQSATTGADGGYLVPEGFMTEIVKYMKYFGPMAGSTGGMDSPFRVITTEMGNEIPWPTIDDTANEATDADENQAAPAATNLKFGRKILKAYKRGTGMILVPNELFQDAYFSENDFSALINEMLGERAGRKENKDLTFGDGVDDPQGIVVGSTKAISTGNNARVTWDEMRDAKMSIDRAYRGMPDFRWMFNDNTLLILSKVKDGDGNYIWQDANVRSGDPATILAKQYMINNDMDDFGADDRKPILVGCMKKYCIRKVRNLRIRRLNERYAEKDQVGFVGWARYDGRVLDETAIKHVASS